MTDYLFGLQLSPPSSGRAICERAIALLFLPLCDFFGLNRRYATAVFFFLYGAELHVPGNEAPACDRCRYAHVNVLYDAK